MPIVWRLRDIARRLVRSPIFWISCIAAMAYSSWPLGYLLNAPVARAAYASQLEASHQPYNWLFVGCDILSGLLLLAIGWRQWRHSRQHILRAAIVAYSLFALLVILAAVMPDNCPTGGYCAELVRTPVYLIHGLSSIVSVALLFLGMALAAWALVRRRHFNWFAQLLLFALLGWGSVGIAAWGEAMRNEHVSNIVQYALISVCSATIMVTVVLIDGLRKDRQA